MKPFDSISALRFHLEPTPLRDDRWTFDSFEKLGCWLPNS